MFLKHLYARHFRNFKEIEVDFVDGVNEVIGDNAQGKTSLLEALFLCMTASSFRTHHLKELIHHKQDGFFVEATFEKSDVTHLVAISYDGERRRVYLNGSPCDSPTVLLGLMPGVASSPDDLALIKGQPSIRRRFLDLMIAQIDPVFVHHLSRYMRALKQRNTQLKHKDVSSIACWEEELSRSSAYIITQRKKAVTYLHDQAKDAFQRFSQNSHTLDLSYHSNIRPQDDLEKLQQSILQEYEKKRAQELYMGATLVGPHRDDLHISIDSKSARDFASVGQSALAAAALRLAEWNYLKAETRERPLMIVDDFAHGLDTRRKSQLYTELSHLGQLFVSSHDSLRGFAKGQVVTLQVHNGTIQSS